MKHQGNRHHEQTEFYKLSFSIEGAERKESRCSGYGEKEEESLPSNWNETFCTSWALTLPGAFECIVPAAENRISDVLMLVCAWELLLGILS